MFLNSQYLFQLKEKTISKCIKKLLIKTQKSFWVLKMDFIRSIGAGAGKMYHEISNLFLLTESAANFALERRHDPPPGVERRLMPQAPSQQRQ